MFNALLFLGQLLAPIRRSRVSRDAEILFLRQQLLVLRRSASAKVRLRNTDRLIFGFKLLYGLVILRLGRRQIVWTNVTANPTAEWIARQVIEAFPWDQAPRYLIRDRDSSYGAVVTRRLHAMGIRDRPIAPRSPWQNGYVERLIGSIRRECLDHVVVLGEAHLRRILAAYAAYYNGLRTHLALDKDAPLRRPVQSVGRIVSAPILGGLQHHYARMA